MHTRFSTRRQAGQSVFEVVLAIGVVTVVLVGVIALIVVVQRNTLAAKNRAEGTRMLLEAQEWLRNQRDTDWTGFYTRSATAAWCLDTLSWGNSGACGANEFVPNKPFLRNLRFTRTLPNQEVRAQVSVNWTDSLGNHEIQATTLLTDWKTR